MPLADRRSHCETQNAAPVPMHLVAVTPDQSEAEQYTPQSPIVRIGSATGCDWVLQGGGIAPWHATLHLERGVCRIEATSADLRLTVQGQPVRRAVLTAGQSFQLGEWELTLNSGLPLAAQVSDATAALPQLLVSPEADQPTQTLFTSLSPVESVPAEDLSALSATELCDRIEEEQFAIEQFEANERRGWQALLAMVHTTASEMVSRPSQIDSVLAQVREITARLDRHQDEMTEHTQSLLSGAASLDYRQDRVTKQLTSMLEQVQGVADQPLSVETSELRASA